MKKFYLIIFAFSFLQIGIYSQWVQKHSGTPVHMSDAVSDQIFWCGRWDTTPGTFCTTDGGQTWTSSTFLDPSGAVLCIDALNADTAYVVASDIYKTTNRGTDWVKQITTFSTGFANCIHFFDANNGVATGDPNGGYFEIYTTTNGGDNWVRVPSSNIPAPLPDEGGIISSFAAYNNTFWFTTFGFGGASGQRIIRSTDRGYTWTLLTTFPIPSSITPSIEFRDSLHGIFIGNAYLIFRTSDGGMTWATDSLPSWVELIGAPSYIPGTLATYVVTAIGLNGKEELYFSLVSTDDGLTWKRMDSWQPTNLNLPSAQRWTSPNSGWMCLVDKGIYKWPGYTGKHIWRTASSLKFGNIVSGEIGDTLGISVGNYGTLPTTISALTLSSTNYSLVNSPSLPIVLQPWDAVDISISFTPQTRGLLKDSLVINSDAANYSSISVTLKGKALEFTPPLSNFIYAASDSLFTFTPTNLPPIPVGYLDGVIIQGLAIWPPDSILIGISNSILYKIDPIVGGLLPLVTIPVENLPAIAFSPSGTLFAGSKSGALYKINLTTGEATPIGTASGKIYSSFSFNPLDGKLYASVAPAVGASKDAIYTVDTLTGAASLIGLTGDGKSTPSISFNADGTLYGLKGTGPAINTLITIDKTNGQGTELGSLGKSGLQAIIMTNVVTGIKDNIGSGNLSYTLYQNYPNPFNSSTLIRYSIAKEGLVTLKIYNTIGEEVLSLLNEQKQAGNYQISFKTDNLPSGVYFYQIKAGEYTSVKKMILLK